MKKIIVSLCLVLGFAMLIFAQDKPASPALPFPTEGKGSRRDGAGRSADRPEVFVQLGHTSRVTSVAFSPDGKYALSGSKDKTLKLWEVATGKEIRTFQGHSDEVTSIAFSPDGRHVLSGSRREKIIKLWEVATGEEIRTFKGHSWVINSVVFSPDGKHILSGSDDDTMKLWEVATGKEIRTFTGHSKDVESVAFSPDGKYALFGSSDKTMKLWEVTTGKEIRTFKGHSWVINSVVFSPDGKHILSGSDDDTMKLWEVATGKEIRTFTGHSKDVESVAFSPDGKYALSGSWDKTMKLWEVATGKEIRTFTGHSDYVHSVAFSPDGKFALSGSWDKTMKLWEVATGKRIRTFKGHSYSYSVNSVALSPDGKYTLSGSDDHTLKLWEVAMGEATSRHKAGPKRDKEIRTFKGHSRRVNSVALSPDGKYALSGSGDKTMKLWEVATGEATSRHKAGPKRDKEIRTFKGHYRRVNSVALSPDGKYALSGSADRTLKLWEVATGKEIRTFTGHSGSVYGSVYSVAFSPDGKYALSGSKDNTLKLWDIATGKEIRSYEHYANSGDWVFDQTLCGVSSVAFSHNGKHALSGGVDGNIKLWELATGEATSRHKAGPKRDKEIRIFEGHSWRINSVTFSPNGQYALSGSNDSTLKLWEVATGKEIKTFKGHLDSVTSVAFSPDGQYALSGSRDTTIRLWDIKKGKEVIQMISFTDGEWICITPEGYFDASPNGARYINVRIGNKVYSVDQFYNEFYRPELVRLAITGKELPKAKSFGDIASQKPAPSLKILSPQTGSAIEKNTIDLVLQVTDNGGGIGDINIYLKGSQVTNDTRGIAIQGKETPKQKVLSFNIPLLAGENQIKIIAFNQDGSMESVPAEITITCKITDQKPSLYAIVVGINEYRNKSISLTYAVPDAKLFAETLKKSSTGLFDQVNITLLTSFEKTSKENIQKTFEEIRNKVSPNDLFVFYDASHGIIEVIEENKQYYLITSNVLSLSSRRIAQEALGHKELSRLIGSIPAQKKLIILDTCHAGKAGKEITVALLQQTRGLNDSTAIKLLQRAIGSAVFSASSDTQQALEGYKGHGLFTYVLVDGLKGAADVNKDGFVNIYELADYVEDQVITISEEVFKHQQAPNTQIGTNFPIGKVK